ncbi:MAG: glycosyltransferase [Pseudomonadota bacterium]
MSDGSSGVHRRRLLAVGWWRAGTGLTRVAAELWSRLAKRWEIHYAGIGYDGPVREESGWTLYPTDYRTRDAFGAHRAAELVGTIQPDIVLAFNDLWFLDAYRRVIRAVSKDVRLVAYLPLDGEFERVEDAAPLAGYDGVIVYTHWALDEVQRSLQSLDPDRRQMTAAVGHGLDSSIFCSLPEGRAELREELFPDLGDPAAAFIALNASRPSPRKDIAVTIEGFARFLATLDEPARRNAFLCLHQALAGQVHRDELSAMIDGLGIGAHVLTPFGQVVDSRRLNVLYNACDVGINTSTGEGWGLVSLEHAATGATQIVPDHSACRELWRHHGILVPAMPFRPSYTPLRMARVSAAGVADALHEAHRRWRARVVPALPPAASMTWDAVADRFSSALDEALSQRA